MNMNIIKIGGAVLRSVEGFNKTIDILNEAPKPLLVVFSAFSNATRILERAARMAETGNKSQALANVNLIIKEHNQYADLLITDILHLDKLRNKFKLASHRLKEIITGLDITRELTPRTLDSILSFGEYFALWTIEFFLLERGFKIKCIDSADIIVSSSDFGKARPLLEPTNDNIVNILKPELDNFQIIITQGFIAKDRNGDITTMGIESSNLTAVLYAELLGAKEITFWTDVEGIRTADPKIIPNTLNIPSMNYYDAYKLASNGLKLIFSEMASHASLKEIKLIYRSAFNPGGEYTIIDKDSIIEKSAFILVNDLVKLSFKISNRYEKKLFLNEIMEINYNFQNSEIIVNQDLISIFISKNDWNHFKLSNNYNYESEVFCSIINIIFNKKTQNNFFNILEEYKNEIIALIIDENMAKIAVREDLKSVILNKLYLTQFD